MKVMEALEAGNQRPGDSGSLKCSPGGSGALNGGPGRSGSLKWKSWRLWKLELEVLDALEA